jgi:hypothetical protein
MAFDPNTRVVTVLLQQTNGSHGQPVYRRLPYDFVTYDGNPTQYLEPRNATDRVDLLKDCTVFDKPTQERIGKFEYFGARPIDVFSIDDFDATASTGL